MARDANNSSFYGDRVTETSRFTRGTSLKVTSSSSPATSSVGGGISTRYRSMKATSGAAYMVNAGATINTTPPKKKKILEVSIDNHNAAHTRTRKESCGAAVLQESPQVLHHGSRAERDKSASCETFL